MRVDRSFFSTRTSTRASPIGLLLCLSFSVAGCLSSLSKHSTRVSSATTPVIDQANAAYSSVQALHDLRVDYDAMAEFDAASPVYNPRSIQSLLSDKDIEVRLAVLNAFKCYTDSLVAITSGTDSPQLQAASKAAGTTLQTIGNAVGPSIESTLGITNASAAATKTAATATSSTSKSASVVTAGTRNDISVAADALGQFLVSRKIRRELPQRIKEMDPHLQALCELLEQDLDTLQDQEQRDYNRIIDQQTLFLRQSPALDPEVRREQIMKLPEIVRQQRASERQLAELRAALARLARAHHELVTAAQNSSSQSLNARLGDLAAAGSDLGKFQSSLPAK